MESKEYTKATSISQKTAISPELPTYLQTKHVPLTKLDEKCARRILGYRKVRNINSNIFIL
jgi:hypothetical protein